MPTKVAEDIYQVRLPIPQHPLGFINVYLVRSKDTSVLIDTGFPSEQALETLVTELESLGTRPADLEAILLTHGHLDHYGLAAKIKCASRAHVWMHEGDTPLLQMEQPGWIVASPDMRRWLISNGLAESSIPKDMFVTSSKLHLYTGLHIDENIEDGITIRIGNDIELEPIWTPGHSLGHICFYDPRRKLLFSGDHILPEITPNIGSMPLNKDNPLAAFLGSVNKVRDLDVDLVLPGHGGIFSDLKGRVDELKEHHVLRLKEVFARLDSKGKTAFDVASTMQWTNIATQHTYGAELSRWDMVAAVCETISHLDYLCDIGEVSRDCDGDRVTYRKSTPDVPS